MQGALIGLFAETNLHPGAEATSSTVVDLPVARDSVTGYPVIPGSMLKGCMREHAEAQWNNDLVQSVFGRRDREGGLTISEARMVWLPVRSLSAPRKLVMSPTCLERFIRLARICGYDGDLGTIQVSEGKALAQRAERLFLEEVVFDAQADQACIPRIAAALKPFIWHDMIQARLEDDLVVVSDGDFEHLVQYLPINAHNELHDVRKTSKNLWYEEIVPQDSLFVAFVKPSLGRNEDVASLRHLFSISPYLRIGANETTGEGWCVVSWYPREG